MPIANIIIIPMNIAAIILLVRGIMLYREFKPKLTEENYDINFPCGFGGLLMAMSILLGLRMLWVTFDASRFLGLYANFFISGKGSDFDKFYSEIWAVMGARCIFFTKLFMSLSGLTLAVLIIINLVKKNPSFVAFLLILNVVYISGYIVWAVFSSQTIQIKDYLPTLVGSVLWPFYFLYSKRFRNTLIIEKTGKKMCVKG